MTPTDEEIRAGLAAVIETELGVPAERVTMQASFAEDLDADSLAVMTLVVGAEDRFGVRLPDDKVAGLRTVADAVALIAAALPDEAAAG